MATKKTISTKKGQTKTVPLEWNVPEGIATPFATNMVVQLMENEFKVSFFEAKPPIQLDGSTPLPKAVRADYVAGVIVSAERLSKFIEVLQKQLDKYHALKSQE